MYTLVCRLLLNVRDSDFLEVYFAFKQLLCVQQSSCITEQKQVCQFIFNGRRRCIHLGVSGKCVLLVVNKS